MSGLELVPIGTILSLLIEQVISTANAVNDVLIEKESFKTLSKYLLDIKPIFEGLQHHELNDNPTVRGTLDSLKKNCDKAEGLVQKYKNCGRFYCFLFCRRIANEIQDATMAIGKSLAMFPLANNEVLSEIYDMVNWLQAKMQKAEYVASQSRLMILEKLNKGIEEQKHDQNFRNSMLEQIASSVGISNEPSEIRKEHDYLRMEKDDAASRKEKQEEIFLKQVIDLLSQADVARDEEVIRKQYDLIRNTVEKSNGKILEYDAFLCPITKSVMVDPVNLCTETTCERAAIEAWFLQGRKEDPRTSQPLEDTTLRPNISVRQSIQQWREQIYALKIKEAKYNLQTGNRAVYDDAFSEIQRVIKENTVTKFWIAIEGIIDIIVLLLGTLDDNLKSRSLQTLLDIVQSHQHNKDKAVAAGVLHHIVECLGRDSYVCTAAVSLLFELLQENDRWWQAGPKEDCRWNEALCIKLKHERGTIAFLVLIILNKQFSESSKKAEDILLQLCCDDDDTILDVASYHWYKPLVQSLCDGSESSKKTMMRRLVEMQLVDEDVKQLGKDGVIDPLVKLASGDAESRELAFLVMAKLSTSYENKRLIVETGAVPLILEQISSPQVSPIISEKCSEIFEKLTSRGLEFLTGPGVVVPEQELMITNLIAVVKNSSTSISIRKPCFRALLSICKSAKVAAEKVIATPNGIYSILPLLEDSDKEIRELTLQLLHQFSPNEPVRIADFLLEGRRLETFMSFLKDDSHPELQLLAIGLLAKLQKAKIELIKSLAELGAIPVFLDMLKSGTTEAEENVLDLLFGFMNPEDIEMQKKVVGFGAYPLLVNTLISGSKTAKARAAALISNLSLNSPKLTEAQKPTGCFCLLRKQVPTCDVHGGICSVESSFCLLEANALSPLVRLFQERDDAVKLQAVRALKTMVQKEFFRSEGVNVLHKFQAIAPLLGVLRQENPALNEEVLEILDCVFTVSAVAVNYSEQARIPLTQLSAYRRDNTDESLRGKAANLLGVLDRYTPSGSMPQ